MRFIYFFIVFSFFVSTFGFAQDISVFTEDNEQITTIIAKNSSTKLTYAVTVNLNTSGYKIAGVPPFEVTLKPGEQKEVVKLVEKPGEKLSLEYQVSYNTVSGHNGPNLENLIVLPKDTIYVFSGAPCSKSEEVVKKLKSTNKVFKNLSLGDPTNFELMRGVLTAQLKVGQVTNFKTPVLVVNGVPITDPKAVDDWVKGLK